MFLNLKTGNNIKSSCLLIIFIFSCNFQTSLARISFPEEDDKLFLTPLLKSGKIREAKELSRIKNLDLDLNIESYSGFLTVNSTHNKNLFFYFVPAFERHANTPLMIWLNGGPGSSSLLALFVENGPFYLDQNLKLHARNITWSSIMSIIYVDSPVQTGFSFTDNDDGLVRSTEEAAQDLYNGVVQFLQIFSEYQSAEFFVGGESYAGKYGPALAHIIHKENEKIPKLKINLKGLIIGSGFFDPINQLDYANFYYSTGLIDEIQLKYFQEQEELTKKLIDAENWAQAFIVLESLIIGYPTPGGISHFETTTGLKYNLNILMDKEPSENFLFEQFLRQKYVRKALHVGNSCFSKFNPNVYNAMQLDIYQSIRHLFIDLLNADYKILLFASQFDAIVPYTTLIGFVNSLANSNWKLAKDYMQVERKIWKTARDEVAGYVKSSGNFTFGLIRNAGHLASTDQPEWTFDLINNFLTNQF